MNKKTENETGEFGPIFRQFEGNNKKGEMNPLCK